jgi:hypothetical protein
MESSGTVLPGSSGAKNTGTPRGSAVESLTPEASDARGASGTTDGR